MLVDVGVGVSTSIGLGTCIGVDICVIFLRFSSTDESKKVSRFSITSTREKLFSTLG